ncbi:dienelactone hydrolase family protein [Xylanimonas protaetiae]|uniref:Alpha/beta hydrolase n=1 Tax=Xylanimonas protaetiae TaxID=2509457 RepID=A0A4P6F688_9MICO|nr:alpha/beta hydrolase [Xylanimonas protaetiae]QAY70935.1 alpha/beta hydrolase [Xylanimonas protaetiae]
MHVTSEQRHDDGVVERELILGDIPGTLWTPASAEPVPLILMAHNNALPKCEPRLVARARHTAAAGYAVASIDAFGCGDRSRTEAQQLARAEFRRGMQAGPTDDVLESYTGPLVAGAVPDWRTTLDALLTLPEIGGPVGYSGWLALGIGLAAVEPRIAAAGFFAGGYVPRTQREAARQVTIPLLVLLQWDDAGNPRQRALDLFDAFGSTEKTLHANLGGHVGTPWFELEDGERFFDRHLRGSGPSLH